MSKILRLAVMLSALTSAAAAMASAAGAVTWHNTGDTAFTASGGAVATFSVTGVSLRCTGTDMTGTSPSASATGPSYTVANGTLTFTSCTLSGLPSTLDCAYSVALGTAPVNHVFSGALDLTCEVSMVGMDVCRVEGSTPATYRNPETGLAAQLTLPTSTTLRTTDGADLACPLTPGEPLHLVSQPFLITSATGGSMSPHTGPTVVRTP
jgi:hypothetical protein